MVDTVIITNFVSNFGQGCHMKLFRWAKDVQVLSVPDFVILSLLGEMNLTCIARSLNITQPAITQRINKCRALFDDHLVVGFGRRKIDVTPKGKIVRDAARAILSMLGETLGQPACAGEFVPFLGERVPVVAAARTNSSGNRRGVSGGDSAGYLNLDI
jgi:hypothetical protein